MDPAQRTRTRPVPGRRRPRLHLFDLDGTLLYGSAAAVEISQQLGVEREIRQLEAAFAAGGLTPPQFAARACALWTELTDEIVHAAFDGAPWLAGIREVWARIRADGEHCAVISLSPDFFVRRLQEWGADATHGSHWPEVPRAMPNGGTKYPLRPLDPSGILSPGSKVKIAGQLCAEFGVHAQDCVAYGDSMSDAALFATVPVSVAVNADHHVRSLASHHYNGRDLREAYGLVSRPR
ncbi:HAD family hydrolase [Streptomyces albus]|uniref:HAD family hydrolase n=1 Tax=Streptomyces albus TaxID=1888 RepID=A0A6C1C4G9_9ACTN|nr:MULTISPECIES: HAD-IB family phosphatase [Streptomyces]KPC96912.1 HAD family hydrolase [Streptomyces sp. NRRL F-6602]QID37160.1 HAD-IB family phosphatase [Streptomyces albus]TGG81450.1 HAD family hydrolase [Streptomyces albus]UVN55906.1 HAD-IB family phosphatase [Streptomyces albus]